MNKQHEAPGHISNKSTTAYTNDNQNVDSEMDENDAADINNSQANIHVPAAPFVLENETGQKGAQADSNQILDTE